MLGEILIDGVDVRSVFKYLGVYVINGLLIHHQVFVK
jgi:hypothetical protein